MKFYTKYIQEICFLTIFIAMGVSSYAQEAYVRLGGGYALGVNKTPLYSYLQNDAFILIGGGSIENFMFNISEDVQSNTIAERIHDSYGQGGFVGISGGYMFHKNFGVDLGISYLFGKTIESTWNSPSNVVTLDGESSFSSLFLAPSLVISAGMEGVNPYARMGAVLGLTPKIETNATYSDGVDDFVEEDELTGGVAVGFAAAVGVTYPLNEQISLFGELVYNSVRYKPSERDIKKLTQSGVDFAPVADKQVLKDEYMIFTQISFIEPELPAYSHSLNSLGINVGLQFNLRGSGLARSR